MRCDSSELHQFLPDGINSSQHTSHWDSPPKVKIYYINLFISNNGILNSTDPNIFSMRVGSVWPRLPTLTWPLPSHQQLPLPNLSPKAINADQIYQLPASTIKNQMKKSWLGVAAWRVIATKPLVATIFKWLIIGTACQNNWLLPRLKWFEINHSTWQINHSHLD